MLKILKESANSNGVYSLYKDSWIKVPVKDDIPDNIDLEPELSELIAKAKQCNTIDKINDYIDNLYILRTQGFLGNNGEYSRENLLFKEIRNKGILDALKDKKTKLETREMSLDSLDEAILSPELANDVFGLGLNPEELKQQVKHKFDSINGVKYFALNWGDCWYLLANAVADGKQLLDKYKDSFTAWAHNELSPSEISNFIKQIYNNKDMAIVSKHEIRTLSDNGSVNVNESDFDCFYNNHPVKVVETIS